jgi:hypothetical protein
MEASGSRAGNTEAMIPVIQRTVEADGFLIVIALEFEVKQASKISWSARCRIY